MPTKKANVKNEKQYEALKDKGMSKERAAKIANSPGASSRGKKSGSGGSSSRAARPRRRRPLAARAAAPPPASPEPGIARLKGPAACGAGVRAFLACGGRRTQPEARTLLASINVASSPAVGAVEF